MDSKTLGELVRARRKERGRTMKEIAEASGISLGYVNNIERGKANPTLRTLNALDATLGLGLFRVSGPALNKGSRWQRLVHLFLGRSGSGPWTPGDVG